MDQHQEMIAALQGDEPRTPADFDGEERYLVSCITRLRRQFEIDSKPYFDKLAAIRDRQAPARFYLLSGQEYIPDPRVSAYYTLEIPPDAGGQDEISLAQPRR